MNKVCNWVFSSFFRTLGRVLVYILIGYGLSFLLSDIKLPSFSDLLFVNVRADSDTIKIYNTTLTSNNYVVVPSGSSRIINILGGNVYGSNGNGEFPPSYYIGTFCTDSSSIISWEGTSMSGTGGSGTTYQNTLSQINFFNTNYSCTFPNSSYTGGHIVYIYGTIDPIWNTSATSATLMGRISYNQPEQASWSLLSWSWSNEPIDIDYSNNTIISQNQDIINQNNTIISNQTNNTNSIINNQNQNKTDIINNQNANTDRQIESQQVCEHIDKNNILDRNKVLWSDGTIGSLNGYGITDYINILNGTIKNINAVSGQGGGTAMCFYNTNKVKISCIAKNTLSANTNLTIPNNAYYFRATINYDINEPQFEICKNGNQAIGDSLNDMNSSINNSDSSGATSDASNFFSNFTTDTHGLTGIITAPLNAINSLTSSQCSPLVLPLPFVNENLTLPCMRSIYVQHFGSFMTLYDVITLGIVSYWVMVRIFSLVKDFKNPEHDEIEVVDL